MNSWSEVLQVDTLHQADSLSGNEVRTILKRVLSGLVGAPVILLIAGFGQEIGLLILILVGTGLGLLEFYRLAYPQSRLWEKTAGIALGLSFPIVAFFCQGESSLAIMVVVVFVLFLLFVAKPGDFDGLPSRMAILLFGTVYIGFLLSHAVLLRRQPMGTQWVFFLLLTVWAGDTCAYFVGTLIGKHKLYPRISPKKTVEGLLGGLAGSIIVAFVFRTFFLKDLAWSHVLLIASIILILGQFGDFGESMIKRSVNVKDSSRLIPGHGGILDRLDSFLFSTPFLYYYVRMALQ